MSQKSKSFLVKLTAILMLFCYVFVAWFALPIGKSNTVAKAAAVEMDDKITISTWGEAEAGITWIHVALSDFTVAGVDWHNADATKIAANNNVDPLEYTYINGKSARDLYTADNSALTVITATNWTEAYVVKVSKSYLALGEFTIQLKAGFTLVGADGSVYELKNDTATYGWTNGAFGVVETTEPEKPAATYTLSFESTEGSVAPITVTFGQAIGELPAVPEKVGCTGVWTINGVEVTADMVYAYGKNKTAVAAYELIEYTITVVRASGAQEEIFFNVENAASKLAEITLTEGNEEYAYSWAEELPTALEAKNYTFIEIELDLLPDTRIISQSVSVGTSFTVNIYVEVVDENIPQMQFTMGETVVVAEGVLVNEELKKYVYRMENIAAYELATEFTASLLIDDKEIDSMTYSVEAYLNALSRKDISNELKTLIADIVVYGQAAEEVAGTENGIKAIDGLTPTEYIDLTDTDYKKSFSSAEGVEITSVYVANADGNCLKIRFTAGSNENLVVKINSNVVAFAEVEEDSGVYEAKTGALYIAGCDDRFKVTISVGDSVAQTLIYSVKSYVYKRQNGTNETEAKYVKALYNCSLSLKAYAEGV